jgi:hypothetical protein
VPEIVAEVPWTGLVVTVNVTLFEPAGIVAEVGTCATFVLLLLSETTAPDGGAAPFNVNVPVDDAPPVTVLGFKAREVNAAAFTVRFVVFVAPYTAVRVTIVCDATPLVVITKRILVEPAGIITLLGTCAVLMSLLCSVTVAPPAGAAPLRVTVPVELFPPTTVIGVLLNVERTGAFTVRFAFFVTVPYVAEITTVVFETTGVVVTVNVVEVLPAAMVTVPVAGTWATDVLLLCRVTTAPPAGAAPFRVTVPVEVFPPTSLAGINPSDDNTAAFTFKVAFLVTVPYVAEMTTGVFVATGVVVIVNVAEVLPAGIVTLAVLGT